MGLEEYDNCYNEGQAGYDLISYNRYAKMSKALNAAGRPMVYAMVKNLSVGERFSDTLRCSSAIGGKITPGTGHL